MRLDVAIPMAPLAKLAPDGSCGKMLLRTSLCRRKAEPADLMLLPVASFADWRPPALALLMHRM